MTPLDVLVSDLARITPAEENSGIPHAAVALMLADDPARLLLIRRAAREGDPWSGHLALPGGRHDLADHDLLDTAIRETREEIGVSLQRDECVARLDDLHPASRLPPIVVRPFVFRVDRTLTPRPGPEAEVVAWVTFDHLLSEGVYRTRRLLLHGAERAFDGYDLPEGFLWGMTERIVTPVVRRWAEVRAAT